ncbi:unnamed protein product [Rhodiola kirilowii]
MLRPRKSYQKSYSPEYASLPKSHISRRLVLARVRTSPAEFFFSEARLARVPLSEVMANCSEPRTRPSTLSYPPKYRHALKTQNYSDHVTRSCKTPYPLEY